MTTTQIRILESLTPTIVELVLKGMEPMEAFKKAIIDQASFCGEMAMMETSRAKLANEVMFNKYCEAKPLKCRKNKLSSV